MSNSALITITGDGVYIADADGTELVCWIKDEWIEDPNVVISIVNAVKIAMMDVQQLKDIIGR